MEDMKHICILIVKEKQVVITHKVKLENKKKKKKERYGKQELRNLVWDEEERSDG